MAVDTAGDSEEEAVADSGVVSAPAAAEVADSASKASKRVSATSSGK